MIDDSRLESFNRQHSPSPKREMLILSSFQEKSFWTHVEMLLNLRFDHEIFAGNCFWCEWFLFNVNDKDKNKSVSLDHSGNAEPILMLNQY